jgi:hypothetical protein
MPPQVSFPWEPRSFSHSVRDDRRVWRDWGLPGGAHVDTARLLCVQGQPGRARSGHHVCHHGLSNSSEQSRCSVLFLFLGRIEPRDPTRTRQLTPVVRLQCMLRSLHPERWFAQHRPLTPLTPLLAPLHSPLKPLKHTKNTGPRFGFRLHADHRP